MGRWGGRGVCAEGGWRGRWMGFLRVGIRGLRDHALQARTRAGWMDGWAYGEHYLRPRCGFVIISFH